tara:strand:+ start:1466 stop:1717 length:252 start_codon:yes stop_codon:yes gene_type:complete
MIYFPIFKSIPSKVHIVNAYYVKLYTNIYQIKPKHLCNFSYIFFAQLMLSLEYAGNPQIHIRHPHPVHRFIGRCIVGGALQSP